MAIPLHHHVRFSTDLTFSHFFIAGKMEKDGQKGFTMFHLLGAWNLLPNSQVFGGTRQGVPSRSSELSCRWIGWKNPSGTTISMQLILKYKEVILASCKCHWGEVLFGNGDVWCYRFLFRFHICQLEFRPALHLPLRLFSDSLLRDQQSMIADLRIPVDYNLIGFTDFTLIDLV